MKSYLNSPILPIRPSGICCFVRAPLGYYLHDFIFNHVAGMSFWGQVVWIHQHNTSTILYIGLGTNLFFTAFGAIIGKYSFELARAHSANDHLKQTKHDLVKHFLSRMRISTTIGLESLLHLREGGFSSSERENLLQSSIQELNKVDESIRNLIELQSYSVEGECKITELEIVEMIKKSSAKYEMLIADDCFIAPRKNYQVNMSNFLFSMAMNQLFEWAKNNEMELNQIQLSYFVHPHKELVLEHEKNHSLFSHHPLIIRLEFQVTGHEALKFEAPFLVDFIEKCQGTCFYHKGSVLILLPAEEQQDQQEQEEKARAA